MPGDININPSSFAEDGGLLDMSMEEVVALFLDKEKRRHRDAKDDENQKEVIITYRSVPMGLIMALDIATRSQKITRSLLTRCISHQITAWYEGMSRIRELSSLFDVAHDAAAEFGYPDLYDGMRPSYVFANTSPRSVSFRTIGWVRNNLSVVSLPLGVPAGALFITGLCFSLSKIGDKSMVKGTIDKYLSVEVSKFTQHIEEQFVRICAFHDIVRRRAESDGLGGI